MLGNAITGHTRQLPPVPVEKHRPPLAVTAAKKRLCLVNPAATGRQLEMEIAMDISTDLLTTDEVALITRAPVSTVRYWRHLGTGPRSFRLGRRVVYRRHEVEQWLSEREMTDASAPAS
jgi:predicted DNA-binding transcriptional regulator AlpA